MIRDIPHSVAVGRLQPGVVSWTMQAMSLPIVAIVGRPNVGKSSLLNCLAGRRIAIVDPTPGVTRDRISVSLALGHAEQAHYVEVVDTGGMGIADSDDLTDEVTDQIDYALSASAIILFVVDAREGVTSLDRHVAEKLRKQDKPVILVANKADLVTVVTEQADLYRLGFEDPILISATHRRNIDELIEAIDSALGDNVSETPPPPVMKLAVVGKRNAGKSTFINSLAGTQRVIVSEKPGTTRDSVDVTIQVHGSSLTLIDTAGLRKKKSIKDDIEFYSHTRAMRSIRRADVVAMMIDASVPVSQVDKSLAGLIAEAFKPVVLVVNKWDLVKGSAEGEDYGDYLTKTFPELSYAPLSLTIAQDATNVPQTIALAEELFRQTNTRVTTGKLNATIAEILALRGPSHKAGTRPPKILYTAQVATAPPTVVCFVNDPRSFDTGYQRFLVNQFRQRLPFAEVPIRLIIRQRRASKKD